MRRLFQGRRASCDRPDRFRQIQLKHYSLIDRLPMSMRNGAGEVVVVGRTQRR
jgi:hypothetical protein